MVKRKRKNANEDVRCHPSALYLDYGRGELICLDTGEVIADHLPYEMIYGPETPTTAEALSKVKTKMKNMGIIRRRRHLRVPKKVAEEIIEYWKRLPRKRRKVSRVAQKFGVSVAYVWQLLNRHGLLRRRNTKVNEEIIRKARKMREEGKKLKEIAEELGISVGTAWKITQGVKVTT